MSQKRQEQFEVSRYPLEKSSRLVSLELKSKTLGKMSWAPSYSVQKWTAVFFGEKSVVNRQEGTGDVKRKIWRVAALIKSPLNPFDRKLSRVLPKRRDKEATIRSWWTEIQPTSALTLEACWSLFMRQHRPVSVRAQWCIWVSSKMLLAAV